jgi:hypothetical protein
MEKGASVEFSIREFGSVSGLGSQSISLRTIILFWLTASVFESSVQADAGSIG